jgi:hypothetical protein
MPKGLSCQILLGPGNREWLAVSLRSVAKQGLKRSRGSFPAQFRRSKNTFGHRRCRGMEFTLYSAVKPGVFSSARRRLQSTSDRPVWQKRSSFGPFRPKKLTRAVQIWKYSGVYLRRNSPHRFSQVMYGVRCRTGAVGIGYTPDPY